MSGLAGRSCAYLGAAILSVATGAGVFPTVAAGVTTEDGSVTADLVPSHAATIYEYAAATAPCSLPWTTLAGVGAVTSDHTRANGEPQLLPDGLVEPTILYEQWDPANPRGLVADTDGGVIDGDAEHDRTVGPMQFLPETWVEFGVDGNGDGVLDPNSLWDAAVSAANRLCDAGVDANPDQAFTRYFGVDTYNDWVRRETQEIAAWQQTERPAPQRRELELLSIAPASPSPAITDPDPDAGATAGAGADPGTAKSRAASETDVVPGSVVPEVAGVEQVPGGGPSVSTIGPSPSAAGRATVTGDWDGSGAPGQAALVAEGDRRLIRFTDAQGRPYGTTIDVSEQLGRPSGSPGLQVGEWDGDGIDDVALVVTTGDSTVSYRFDRGGRLIDERDLGELADGSTIVVGPAPGVASLLGDEAVWKTVTIHDGTSIELWKVGGIIVEESMVDSTSKMLAAAAADGIILQGWGWRSHDAQIELRRAHCADVWTTPASQCSPPTAVPGTSRHETGKAIDFHTGTAALDRDSKEFAWLVENAESFGFFNLASEPWHWSVDGG